MTTATDTNHAERNATGHAQTIEALYELHCWDFSTGETPQPLTSEANYILQDLAWDMEGATADSLQEAIREYAQEMPLTVLVRSGWHLPGEDADSEEFEILLSTGGPACRIIGELDRGSVAWQSGCRPTIQYQDWFKLWSESTYDVDINALLWFCEQLYFGE